MYCKKIINEYESYIYAVARILVGFLFFQHGAQKLFGWFTDNAMQPLLSKMGVVGFFELAIGLALVFGLFTRLASVGGVLLGIIIYFNAHFSPDVLMPVMNRGELILLYVAAFALIAIKGNGIWSLEQKIWKSEMF